MDLFLHKCYENSNRRTLDAFIFWHSFVRQITFQINQYNYFKKVVYHILYYLPFLMQLNANISFYTSLCQNVSVICTQLYLYCILAMLACLGNVSTFHITLFMMFYQLEGWRTDINSWNICLRFLNGVFLNRHLQKQETTHSTFSSWFYKLVLFATEIPNATVFIDHSLRKKSIFKNLPTNWSNSLSTILQSRRTRVFSFWAK